MDEGEALTSNAGMSEIRSGTLVNASWIEKNKVMVGL